MLRSKDSEQEWRRIENNEIWISNNVLSSLRLSYDNLPHSSLKRCFVYCSIIPKDTRIYRDKLIQIWMTLGFLSPPLGCDERMEDIGIKFFNILLWHSLLQDIKWDEFGNIMSCKMHDLVHDLALDLCQHHSVTVKTGTVLNHVSKATYLRLDKKVSDRSPTILKRAFGKVRLLFARGCVFHDVLPYITHLTVLVLNSDGVGTNDVVELPKQLRYMKYIKYLDISCLRCKVPSYITELYNLQTLRVRFQGLPKNFYKLINLRHLYIKFYSLRKCLFNGIERLNCLQTLPHFVVSKDQNCPIEQLGGLHNLGGVVKLYGLCDVGDMQEASTAKLCTKSNIECLVINWYTTRVNNSQEESVIEGLEPHTNTKQLIIQHFMGKRLASWITKMINLVKISLLNCERCSEFPSLGHLPKLRKMELENMYDLKIIARHVGNRGAAGNVTTMYPSLTELRLLDSPELEEWLEPDMSKVNGDHSSIQFFPKLEVVSIVSCSKLTRLPGSCFPALKESIISNSNMILESISTRVSSLRSLKCSDMHINDLIFEGLLKNISQSLRILKLSSCQGLTHLTVSVTLEELHVWDCPDITSIFAVKDEILSLRVLNIRRCPFLSVYSQIVSSTIQTLSIDEISPQIIKIGIPFPNLTTLRINGNERSIFEYDDRLVLALPGVTHLEISDFRIKAIPDVVAKFPSLEKLFIFNCRDAESVPTFESSHSIRCLEILHCPFLVERCRKETGEEWYKIQHIPIIKLEGIRQTTL